ncbi:hypothetical protein EI16_02665 [Hydrogenovibrio marinus]|jgi:succinate dehydrogenase hydrophobic anchor subunit|uniref:Uncharacterized protein n=1 Tax=Hydrogenovibrio marinus TaxID=28885 RepID=A0A066ZSJ6_HYDMR|nr:hypothetical protein EI16_02665 [Hydrogenovibrio marinus]MBD3821319.1 hypothetical protein [Thiotrichales bacterium]BBN59701.1 hypothetical protein HVMH_1295 [Hydrogenovibrio marinus]
MYIAIELLVLVLFLIVIWPNIKNEEWKEKFIDNKLARSILIIFVIILLFSLGIGLFFDIFFPVERLDVIQK